MRGVLSGGNISNHNKKIFSAQTVEKKKSLWYNDTVGNIACRFFRHCKRTPRRKYGRNLQRRQYQSLGRLGRSASAPRYVYRHDGRKGLASYIMGNSRQRDRRGVQRLCYERARHDPPRRQRVGRGRRTRHTRRHSSSARRIGRRGSIHAAPRGRQIRHEQLRALGRSARRRRVGHQRAQRMAEGRGAPRRQSLSHGVRVQRSQRRGQGRSAEVPPYRNGRNDGQARLDRAVHARQAHIRNRRVPVRRDIASAQRARVPQ